MYEQMNARCELMSETNEQTDELVLFLPPRGTYVLNALNQSALVYPSDHPVLFSNEKAILDRVDGVKWVT